MTAIELGATDGLPRWGNDIELDAYIHCGVRSLLASRHKVLWLAAKQLRSGDQFLGYVALMNFA